MSKNTKTQRTQSRIEVIYEDPHVIVIEKPAGVISYPTGEHRMDSAIQLIRKYWRARRESRPAYLYLLHRLDKETSGLMVFAKSTRAREFLRSHFERHTVIRGYSAMTSGIPKRAKGRIHTSLGRNARGKRAVTHKGKEAITEYAVVRANGRLDRALIHCRLHTGRTHQVRIHLAYIGAPVLGDPIYGTTRFSRMALYADTLGFVHPQTLRPVMFKISLPEEWKRLV
jgi:23S rRNA pseudouridine1911/1915/1917 synthase